MLKKTSFNEVWYCNQFYIGGVDILSEANRQFIKTVDINLSAYDRGFPYKYIEGAKLYRLSVRGVSFKAAIAEISTNVRIIAYLSHHSFIKSVKVNDDKSRRANDALLYAFAIARVPHEQNSDDTVYVYNKDSAVRLRIVQTENGVIVQKQRFFLNPDATIDIPNDLSNNPYEFLGWYENIEGVSAYETVEQALKDINIDV